MQLHVLGLSSGAKLASVAVHDTVDSLKRKLYQENLVPDRPSWQKLIYCGRTLLRGSELLSDAGMSDGDVIVVMKRRGTEDDGNGWEQRERSKPAPDLSLINSVMESQAAGPQPTPAVPATGGTILDGGRSPNAARTAGASSGAALSVEESLHGLRIDYTRAAEGTTEEGGVRSPARAPGQGTGITLPKPDASAMEGLLEMGFGEARARKALLLNRNHPRAAMEWLLEIGDSPEADSELTDAQICQIVNVSGGGQTMQRRRREALAEPVEPDEVIVLQLVEMGFPREDVLAALAASHNDYDAACAWLLGERGGMPEGQGTGGTPESMHMLLGEILSHPAIQQGLESERVLQAFQAMIEDPSSAHRYLNDPEIGPILLRVHSILSRVAEQRNNPGNGS